MTCCRLDRASRQMAKWAVGKYSKYKGPVSDARRPFSILVSPTGHWLLAIWPDSVLALGLGVAGDAVELVELLDVDPAVAR